MRLFRRRSPKSYLCLWLTFAIILVFYIEFFSYLSNTYSWLEPKCQNEEDCTRILLVADPQVLGVHEKILKHFSIMDSDLFLKRTYFWAFRFANPHVVIFLGDLMDEGSKAKDEEFYSYVRRIYRIFTDGEATSLQHIWLPGDNDIGGEEFDRVTEQKVKRFHRSFSQPDLITRKNLTFFKINQLTQTIPVFKGARRFRDTSRVFVGLSHLPLLYLPSPFIDKVFRKMAPHVLFTAHEHKAMIIVTDALLRQNLQVIPVTPDNNKLHEFTLGDTDMYEFILPTCSYRMGDHRIGYGFAIIEKNEVRFTVLWSPSRFLQLFYYVIFLTLSFLCSCLFLVCRCCSRKFFR